MKDSRYEALEDRVEEIEKIIDEIIVDFDENYNEDEECIAILPDSIVKEMEKIVKHGVLVIGIT